MNTIISAENEWMLFAILTVIAAAAIWMEQRFSWAAKLSGCVIALLLAMLLSNLHVIPTEAPVYDFVWSYIVPMTIPMLLLKADIRKIWRESGRMFIIFMISSVGSLAGAFAAFSVFGRYLPESSAASAMLVGTYTGGSVNLVAMADAFDASEDLVSAAVVSDNLTMAVYFFVLIGIPVSGFFRRHFKHPYIQEAEAAGNEADLSSSFWSKKEISLLDVAKLFATAAVITAFGTEIAGWFSEIIPENGFLLTLLNGLLGSRYLVMTTLTVTFATLFPGFAGNIRGADEIGTFMIHIFFAVIGVPASIYLIVTKAPILWVICITIVAFNMLFSFVFGKLLGFSLEEICAASNANVGGPTTAAAYVIARGWQALVAPSLLVGTLGYVIGNYYGIFIGNLM